MYASVYNHYQSQFVSTLFHLQVCTDNLVRLIAVLDRHILDAAELRVNVLPVSLCVCLER